jgi:hypothetical protein
MSHCSVFEQPVNAPYFVVRRPLADGTLRYFIERMNNRLWTTVEDCWCVDAGVSTLQSPVGVTLVADAASGSPVFTAGGPVFLSSYVGVVIRAGGGIAVITDYISPTNVRATWLTPTPLAYPGDPSGRVPPFPPFGWTLTNQVTAVSGLSHLIGKQVVGLADGVPIGLDPSLKPLFPGLPPTSFGLLIPDATGTVTLPFKASAVCLGLGFSCQYQSVYLSSGQPTQLGRRKAPYAVTAVLEQSAMPQMGANQTDASTQPPAIFIPWNLPPIPPSPVIDPRPPAGYTSPGGQPVSRLFTAQAKLTVPSQFSRPGQIAVQQLLPLPLNITAVQAEILEGDMPENVIRLAQPERQGAAA